ncbi:hypothetical protein ABT024_30950 [Streptomyces sp. NPDC002812]|uniref:hypothetical protein n=1 Tax=Streptomyces sp. NPDC002812 TaxID=3154434 RepID=UPI003322ECF2
MGRDPEAVRRLAQSDRDRLTLHLQHALGTFVHSPREAVEEAETEDLRLALRQYREITLRLLRM